MTEPLREFVTQPSSFKHIHSKLGPDWNVCTLECVCVLETEWEIEIVSMSMPVHMLLQHKVRRGEERETLNYAGGKKQKTKPVLSKQIVLLGFVDWNPPSPQDPPSLAGGRACSATVGFLWRSCRRHHGSINQVKATNRSQQKSMWLV